MTIMCRKTMTIADQKEVTYECMLCGERQTLTVMGRGRSTMHREHGPDACKHIGTAVEEEQ